MLSVTNLSHLEVETASGVYLVRILRSDLQREDTASQVRDRLLRLVEPLGFRKLVLNLSGVDSLGSSMVAALIVLRKRLLAADGQLALCGLSRSLAQKLFDVLKLATFFDVFADEDEAVQNLSQRPIVR